jgi:hypothetical protein
MVRSNMKRKPNKKIQKLIQKRKPNKKIQKLIQKRKPNKKIQKLIQKLPANFVSYLRTTSMSKKYPELKEKT